MNNAPKSSLHPLLVGAAGAVILVSGLGAAAIMGWLPTSHGQTADPALNANGQPIASQSATAAMPAPVSAPVHHQSAPVHHSAPVHVASAAPVCHDCGVIETVNEVDAKGQGSGVGAVGGAVVGGLLGNQVGSGHGRQLATVAGAIGGAFAGNQIEGKVKTVRSYDITVRMNGGEIRTIHQSEQPSWRSGDHVRLVDGALRSNG